MGHAPVADRILQCACDVLLADNFGKRERAKFSGDDLVAHAVSIEYRSGEYPSGADRSGESRWGECPRSKYPSSECPSGGPTAKR